VVCCSSSSFPFTVFCWYRLKVSQERMWRESDMCSTMDGFHSHMRVYVQN